ncbi:PH domain-containing protein, partial [Haematococcus lacustris]
ATGGDRSLRALVRQATTRYFGVNDSFGVAQEEVTIQAKKYQKRWFELTDETLAYAKDPKELKEANIVVFSLLECQWVKRIDEIKLEVRFDEGEQGMRVRGSESKGDGTFRCLQMRFPERVLRVAAESPGQADKWLHAMERVLSKRGAAQGSAMQRSASSFTPEPVKRNQIITAFTIEADSDEGESPVVKAAPAKPAVQKAAPLLRQISPPKSQSLQLPERPPSPRLGSVAHCAACCQQMACLLSLCLFGSTCSPHCMWLSVMSASGVTMMLSARRSLLANPRMGNMMMSTPTKAQPSEDDPEQEVQPFHSSGSERDSQALPCTTERYDSPVRTRSAEPGRSSDRAARLNIPLQHPPPAPNAPALTAAAAAATVTANSPSPAYDSPRFKPLTA